MANSAKLSDGTTNYEFVYDSVSQTDFKVRYGMRVGGSEPKATWHQPDSAPPQLIRLVNENQVIFITTIIYGTDRNDVLNNLINIKRWVDGEDQQAARYHTHGDVNEIYCRIQLDGATNYTDWSVIYGNVDDSEAMYNVVADNNTLALDVTVMLVVEPLGTGAAITLRNDLPSSPHFLEDSNSDGVADGWTAVNSPTSTALITSQYLFGGKSQQVITNSSTGQGIQSSTVTVTSGTACVAYIWIRGSSTSDPITISFLDGSNVTIASATFLASNPSGYDKTAVGGDGNTWYRYSFSGTNTNANVKMSIVRASANATAISTFRVAASYIQTGTSTIPDAWCSSKTIYNRYDPVSANPERINYVDVWGVPGDSDAIIDTSVTCTAVTGTKNVVIGARQTDGTVNAADILHWVDDADMSWGILSGAQSNPADATRSAGEYLRHTADASSVDRASLFIDLGGAFAELVKFLSVPHRVYLITRSSSTATTYEMQLGSSYVFLTGGASTVTPNAANTWELLDLGYLNPIDRAIGEYGQTSGGGSMTVHITPGATSATVDVDACLLIPATGGGLCIVNNTLIAAAFDYVTQFIGTYGMALGGRDSSIPGFNGELWTIPNGNRMSRFIFAYTSDTNVHHLTDAATVSFLITPRTRHLLGTS